jgi:hypothetical protein
MPIPKGKVVRTTTYHNVNLFDDLVTGRSMTGILHMLNQTPIHWFSNRQGRIQYATSELMAAPTATEQIMDIRYTLCIMGVPIEGPSWMFGDEHDVITSSTIPKSSLNKWHNALSYHFVRKFIAAEIIYFIHVEGKFNPSDLFTKILGWAEF